MGRNPFDKIDDADVGGAQEPFLRPRNVRRDMSLPKEKQIVSSQPAKYILRIDECELKETRKSGDAFKSKFVVEHVFDQTPDDGTNPVGSVAVYMVMASTDGFARDVKTFACTAMNYNPELFKKADAEAVVSRAQPITRMGRRVMVTVDNVKTKEKGNDFTTHRWEPIDTVIGADGKPQYSIPARDEVAEFIKRKGQSAL